MQKKIVVFAVILVILAGSCLYLIRSFGVRTAAASFGAILLATTVLTLILDRLLP